MRQRQKLYFGATGLMAAGLTLGLGASPAWACHGPSGNSSKGSNSGGHANTASTEHANSAGSASSAGDAGGSAGTTRGSDQPAGNNGTVKIDEYAVDSGQDNDAHVSCGFTVSFYGFDGTKPQTATINVTPVAPTSGGSTYTTTTGWTKDSRTGGSQLDQQVQVSGSDLASSLAGVTPQAKQGYHLRLEVEVSGSQGSDDKYKVFWMQPCPTTGSGSSGTTPTAGGTTPGGTTAGGTTTGGTTTGSTTNSTNDANSAGTISTSSGSAGTTSPTSTSTATLASSRESTAAIPGSATNSAADSAEADSAPADSTAGPLGVLASPVKSAAVPTSATPSSNGSLAFTGASIAGLIALGLGLITAGLLLTRRWRRADA